MSGIAVLILCGLLMVAGACQAAGAVSGAGSVSGAGAVSGVGAVSGAGAVSGTSTSQAPPSCADPSPPNNGTAVTWGGGLLVEYACDAGTFPIGRTFGSCDRTRKRWSIRKPKCVSSACDHPGNVTAGRVYLEHNGGVATVVCRAGYRLVGARSRYCNGYTWLGFTSTCRDKFPARNPLQASQLNTTVTKTSYLEDVKDADSTCSHVYRAPPALANGTYKTGYEYNARRAQWVMVVNYTCNSGSALKHPHAFYRYCKHYKWKATLEPECQPVAVEPANACTRKNGGCGHVCVPHAGGRSNCRCRTGYALMADFRSCKDIDECRLDNGGCEHFCHNLPGSHFCTCRTGYMLSGNTCLDIDECSRADTNNCRFGCLNVAGSYTCNCSVPGYTAPRYGHNCRDIDECGLDNGGCEHLCLNTDGSYKCKCSKGYSLAPNNRSCEDLDECLDSKRMKCKGGVCTNTDGSYLCECNEGYKLKKSKRRCVDIDECVLGGELCDQQCINTQGAYLCACLPGYALASFNSCAPCALGYYRSAAELECTACPSNATTTALASVHISQCECLPGFQGNVTLGEDCTAMDTDFYHSSTRLKIPTTKHGQLSTSSKATYISTLATTRFTVAPKAYPINKNQQSLKHGHF